MAGASSSFIHSIYCIIHSGKTLPKDTMARNTQVAADHNPPPVTQILAKFVATHPGYLQVAGALQWTMKPSAHS